MSGEILATEYGKIRNDFIRDRLADLCLEKIGVQTGPFGSQLHNEDYIEIGTPIITVEHLGENRILHKNTPCVSDKDKERLSKYHLQSGDIVFSRVGSVDRRALVRKLENGWLFSGRCLRVRVDNMKIDPVYLSYFFGLENFKHYIRSIAVGATMPSINTKILSDVPIYYPKIGEQRKIANILSSLDNKIELNRQINQTLEQMTQAIFKSWFVDFEPVKAKVKANGEWKIENGELKGDNPELAKQHAQFINRAAIRAISGKSDAELNQLPADQLSQLATTAALFPDEMVESELGMIPKGWQWSIIGNEVEVVGGGTPSTKNPTFWVDGTYNWTTPKDLSGNPNKILLNTDRKLTGAGLDKISSGLLPVNTVLLSSRAPVGYLALAKVPVAINQGYIAMKCEKLLPPVYILQWAHSVMDDIKQRASGTTFAEINKKNFRIIPILLPNKEILNNYRQVVSGLYENITELIKESTTLEMLRDTLLPKLLSGEITVADTQAKIEAAV